MEAWIQVLVGAALSVLFTLIAAKLIRFLSRGVSIEATEEQGPTNWEHGFTENSIKVTIRNGSGEQISIGEIRLMFTRKHGFPVLPKAPTGGENPTLPATLDSGRSMSWHFPTERMAHLLKDLSLDSYSKTGVGKLQPRFSTTTGRSYKGRRFSFSLDVNAHW